ncbi:hypothetical protein [Pseudoroseicyclus sp. CXY001]|uniref:hypothetical protein n=1 Tax=Pseudoroseicyclus sp. CXY001 TaxID=3242492 RepID=UPI00358DB5EE
MHWIGVIVERGVYIEEINGAIKDWAAASAVPKSFSKILIFGSLINRSGRNFVPQGATASDVDLILLFSESVNNASSRSEALIALRDQVSHLEHRVAKILARASTDPIFSILPLTSYEIHQCIHKGHDPKLFLGNVFHDVMGDEGNIASLGGYVDYDYHYENLEAFSVIRLAQAYRNEYLGCNHLGICRIHGFSGELPLPKQIMRSGALLRYFASDREDQSFRTDLEEGYHYLLQLFERMRASSALHQTLWDHVSARSLGRGEAPDLTPDDMLLAHEVMYDEAKGLVVPSVRDAIREVMEAESTPSSPN